MVFENSRLIAWKTGKPFNAKHLFFRTLDSGRLLADFCVQFFPGGLCTCARRIPPLFS
ncbi:hypothetical protein B0H10DRAFT_1997656 [Mycena sp. CBHHK59/15]|nr:hypothetical protein B0H10DRAFT_1997656 [Mycena sp. CBHHK59/15]